MHALLFFPIAVTTFCVVVTWCVAAIGGTLTVAWDWSIPRGPDNRSLAEMRETLTVLADQKAAAVSALRKLERDMHDGPQQQLDTDPEALRKTLDELRALSRGFIPSNTSTAKPNHSKRRASPADTPDELTPD